MSTVFIFGAGASHGSGPCEPHAPPLGNQLFPELQKQGGVAKIVSPELAETFKNNFEEGMDQFWEKHNIHATDLLKEMAVYFSKFEPQAENCYVKLINGLKKSNNRFVLSTTNYELLIEHAICKTGNFITYGGLPVKPKNMSVLKIHGSCNFLPDVDPKQITGVSFDLSASKTGSILNAAIKPARSTEEILNFCKEAECMAPALALYSPSKQVLFGKSFVEAQKTAWVTEINRASKIYIIGLRVHIVDEHIWGELSKTKGKLFYVGKEPDSFKTWAQSSNRKNTFFLSDSFEHALPIIANHHNFKL